MRGRAKPRAAVTAALLLVAVVAALALPAWAWGGLVTPEAGPTKNAQETETLYTIVLVVGLAVIGLVWGVLFYSLFRFRHRRGRRVPRIHGNTPLEIGWTIGATAIVVAITIVTYIFLDDIRDPAASGPASVAEARSQVAAVGQPPPPGGKGLEIQVSGQQFLWRYQYPNGVVSFQEMVVPRDQTVLLTIKANDVIHSWWIPALGGKQDAVPGYDNETWFKATETGVFEGQCAELCGSGHAAMTAKVRVVEPAQYEAWLATQEREIAAARRLGQVQRRQIEAEQSR